jgi:hypothetical protein
LRSTVLRGSVTTVPARLIMVSITVSSPSGERRLLGTSLTGSAAPWVRA